VKNIHQRQNIRASLKTRMNERVYIFEKMNEIRT